MAGKEHRDQARRCHVVGAGLLPLARMRFQRLNTCLVARPRASIAVSISDQAARPNRSTMALQKAGRSLGFCEVTSLPSSATSLSTQVAPALRRSVSCEGQDGTSFRRRRRRGLWQIAAMGFRADYHSDEVGLSGKDGSRSQLGFRAGKGRPSPTGRSTRPVVASALSSPVSQRRAGSRSACRGRSRLPARGS